MYKDVLRSIAGIEIWPLVSLTIFFIFFVCLIYYVARVDKGFIAEMANLPVEEENTSNPSSSHEKA